MRLTNQEAVDVVSGENKDWKVASRTETVGSLPSGTPVVKKVYKHKPSGKFYQFVWLNNVHFEFLDNYYCPIEVVEVDIEIVSKQLVPRKAGGRYHG